MLTNKELENIEKRHKDRKEFSDHIPRGPYLYDSFAFVENCFEFSPERPGNHPEKRVGILVRRRDWFRSVNMDANPGTSKQIKEYLRPCSDLGEYIARVCTQSVEEDIAALLAEVKRLKEQVGNQTDRP